MLIIVFWEYAIKPGGIGSFTSYLRTPNLFFLPARPALHAKQALMQIRKDKLYML
jgi:hypothetical protein